MPSRSPLRSWLILAGLFCLAASLSAFGAADPASASIATHRTFLWRPFLAPFHAVVLHFPIGFVTMAFVLELYRLRHPSAELKRVTTLTIWLSLLAGMVAATLGILRATNGGYEPRELEFHRWTGLAVVTFTLLTLAMQRFAYRDETRRALTFTYRASLLATLGLLVIAGHMGGNLTHGSKYLTENAPPFIRNLMGESDPTPATAETAAASLGEAQRYYIEKVQPIFDNKCARCHGREKQKGDYRLDQADIALQGGESGKPAIKPGDPLGSELIRLILLPPGDDDIMPPSGKEPLTAEETLTIIRWIQKGALFPTARVAAQAEAPR
ncbi:MAG: hypothetical protein P4L99_03460 [Chthoniobacter sp.]|nr:hypothetical protein [Chthoniobacter sp.]